MIPLHEPCLAGNESHYVNECLGSNWISSASPYVERFEGEFARRLGIPHAVSTVNGTAALHLALLSVGVQPDDEVVVPTLTFIATANAVRYVGAWPVFIDVEPEYWQIDATRLARVVTETYRSENGVLRNRVTGRRLAALLPVHLLGHPVDVDAVLDVARRYDLPVVEDATESLGALYRGTPVGTVAAAGCFSFNGNKMITTGGGGMLVTADAGRAARVRYLSTQAKDDPLEHMHGEVGYNYRLTGLQAALGCAQLERLDEHIAAKRRIAARYSAALSDVPGLSPMPNAAWADPVFWLYTVRVGERHWSGGRRALLGHLAERGIQTRPLWQPLHLSKAMRGAVWTGGAVAEHLYEEALSIPCSVQLKDEEQKTVIDALSGRS